MKYIIILGDGMADEPIPELDNKTPLQAASTPTIDWLAYNGRLGMLHTVPNGYTPGSEIANLALLGYNIPKVFEGRGSLEAASMGVEIEPNQLAARCNLICVEDGKIKNHSAGHISTEDGTELINYLEEKLGNEIVKFHAGISYRHLLKINGGNKDVTCTPPHDVPGVACSEVMVTANSPEAQGTADLLNNLIIKSQELLKEHPINLKRIAKGKDPANSIWMWSPGYKPSMETLSEQYGIESGVVISAVDLIRGIGVYAGLTPIIVEGATGLYDTNYEGKAEAAIEALKDNDFVFLHVEASDEAGHEGDYELKKRTIEYLDSRICKPVLEATLKMDEPVAIAVLPDHPTPCRIKTHTNSPVPFIIFRPGTRPDKIQQYDEFNARYGDYGVLREDEFIKEFLRK
ncbi:MAG: cofactor-independent phosphoglycerate mutase [Bacteroidales bacterium]